MKQMIYRKVWNICINKIAASNFLSMKSRAILYKQFKMDLGNSRLFAGQFFVTNNIKIGNGTFINYNCLFENSNSKVTIGKNCDIAMNVTFCGVTHEISASERRAGLLIGKDITVGDGTWIGTNVTVLPGVTIGKGCVIGAGSVVNKKCVDNGLYVGVPARLIRMLET